MHFLNKSAILCGIDAIFLILLGCESRTYDNPVDPDSPNYIGTSNSESEKDSTSTDSSKTCVTGCDPTADTVYKFANDFTLTPTGCANIDQLRMFDTGSGLTFFFRADCGNGMKVYSLNSSYTGLAITSAIDFTPDCTTLKGIDRFAVDRSDNEYLLSYSCQTAIQQFDIVIVTITLDGHRSTPTTYESLSNWISGPSILITWNSSSKTYGWVRDDRFQQFSEAGVVIGGPIAMTANCPHKLIASNGNWFLFDTYNKTDAFSREDSYCAKISASGTATDSQSFLYPNRVIGYLGGDLFFSRDGDNYTANVLQLNESNCEGSLQIDYSNNAHEFVQDTGLDAIKINSSTGIFAERKNKDKYLEIVSFPLKGSTDFSPRSSVTAYSKSLDMVQLAIIQNKIYVAYAKDGGLYLNYSTQNIPK